MKLIFTFALALSVFAQSPKKPAEKQEVACPPDKALLDSAEAMTKQMNGLRAQLADQGQKIALLKMMVSQKDSQLQWYEACLSAGIFPDGRCEVNLATLTIVDKTPREKK
jgi:hypothetical protein